MENFNFYQVSDLHLYATEEIGSCGSGFEFKCDTDQKCMAESCAIIDAAFKKLCEDKENEVVILSGDLTFDGEKASHDVMVKKIETLKAAGKKVYVTFATHDFHMEARGYNERGAFKVPKYTRDELRDIYADCGWNEAISEHRPSYSYSVTPSKGIRFLMLNDDGDAGEFCGYYDDLLEWIKEQSEQAKAKGERVIAVTHHPVLPPAMIYPLFSHRDMLGGYETTAAFLADCGIEYVFTGHTHMQSISYIDTEKGNRLYHINTGSIISPPAPIRKVTVTQTGLDVKTTTIDSFDWPMRGMNVREYMQAHFDYMLQDIFYSMEYDIEHFKLLAKGFSMDAKTVDRLKPLIKTLGKIINRLTFRSLGRLLAVSSKVSESVYDLKVKDFILDLIRRMFTGERCYTPDTDEYKSFMPMAEKIGKLVKLKDKQGNEMKLTDIIEDLLYNTGEFDNTNAFLPY